MSKILLIRHLPTTLSFKDKEQLLKHFGADKVWQTSLKRNYIFASFGTEEKAKASLGRLHQLEIANRRLVVEYSFETEPDTHFQTDTEQISSTTKLIKEFLRALNAWNPSIDLYQPPLPHFKYKYPNVSPEIAINILHVLFTHNPFYTQALHLMNKMCLKTPFHKNTTALNFFKETFRYIFIDDIPPPLPQSELESEISSDETVAKTQQITAIKTVKRKRKLPMASKKQTSVLSTSTSATKVKKVVSQEEVFEVMTVQEPKKISVIVHQDALHKPAEEPELEVVGKLGKFQKEDVPKEMQEVITETELPTITKKELLQNRISYRDMKILPVFKNYHPGQPSMRLYIKNLAKSVSEQDVKRIYRRYTEGMTDEEVIGFDVRVMQEGRMKGQGFVTFPSVSIAEMALHETNGYMLKERPMVVQFARVANKKTIELCVFHFFKIM